MHDDSIARIQAVKNGYVLFRYAQTHIYATHTYMVRELKDIPMLSYILMEITIRIVGRILVLNFS